MDKDRKIEVDKDFLFKVLKQVDDLTVAVETLKNNSSRVAFTFEEFVAFNNRLVAAQMKALNLPYTEIPVNIDTPPKNA